MHKHRLARAHRVSVLAIAAFVALVVTAAAHAEFPTLRSNPSIGGTPQEGQTLEGRKGQWLMADGTNCPDCSFRYTWQRCNVDGSGCTDIGGATAFTYTLTAADVGRRIRFIEWIRKVDCGAHGTDCREIERNSVSPLTAPVAPKPIATATATAPPRITGVAMEDEVLQAAGGTWTGPGTITKVIYWQRCNISGEACATITGRTGATYRVTPDDVGYRLRVVETATNEGGTAQAVSAPTAVVVELRPSRSRPTISASRVTLPHRLIVDQIRVTQTGRRVVVRLRVSDTRGFRVTGVLVKATPTGLLNGKRAERATNATGWATFAFTATGSGTTFVYAEAHKRGEKAQSGVSSANLFRVRVR